MTGDKNNSEPPPDDGTSVTESTRSDSPQTDRTQSDNYLSRYITRRQAIKASGLAAIGFVFSKPLIDTLRPTPIFAQQYDEPTNENGDNNIDPIEEEVVLTPRVVDEEGVVPGKDATIAENQPDSQPGILAIVGPLGTQAHRGLVEFQLPGTIPPGPSVISAILRLFLIQNSGGPIDVGVHKVTDAWDRDTVSWVNQPSIVSSAEDTISVGAASEVFYEWDIAPLVRDWVDEVAANYGVMIKAADESGVFSKFFCGNSGGICFDAELVIAFVA